MHIIAWRTVEPAAAAKGSFMTGKGGSYAPSGSFAEFWTAASLLEDPGRLSCLSGAALYGRCC